MGKLVTRSLLFSIFHSQKVIQDLLVMAPNEIVPAEMLKLTRSNRVIAE